MNPAINTRTSRPTQSQDGKSVPNRRIGSSRRRKTNSLYCRLSLFMVWSQGNEPLPRARVLHYVPTYPRILIHRSSEPPTPVGGLMARTHGLASVARLA